MSDAIRMRIEGDDILLFRLALDGTVAMQALALTDWLDALSEGGGAHPEAGTDHLIVVIQGGRSIS